MSRSADQIYLDNGLDDVCRANKSIGESTKARCHHAITAAESQQPGKNQPTSPQPTWLTTVV
jgi:hypothetical protein